MHPHLQRALEEMETAARGMSQHLLARRSEGKWSLAEILEHLALAFGSTSKLLARHLDSRQLTPSRPTLRQRFLSMLVITLGQFPEGRPAPEFTLPTGADPRSAPLLFRQKLAAMDEMLTRCEKRFGAEAPVASHFVFGPLTAAQWRKFHLVHTRHHIKQVRKLKE